MHVLIDERNLADKDGDLGLRELLDIQKLEDDIQNVLTPSLLFR
jgi:hypothetical protein